MLGNLNTSHVNVNLYEPDTKLYHKANLNTSHVNVNPIGYTIDNDLGTFKYISC